MINDSIALIDNFKRDLVDLGKIFDEEIFIVVDSWKAPQITRDFNKKYAGAVYVFSLSDRVGFAPMGRVLKVGKVGSNSNPRFRYQHYNPGSAGSTLAGAVLNNPLLWNYIGYDGQKEIGGWLKQNTDRENFYFMNREVVALFEVYAKAVLGPVYEGSMSVKGE